MNAVMPMVPTLEVISWRVDMVILLSRGVSISEACETLGISRAKYYRHVRRDPNFEAQVERARTIVSIDLLRVVRESKDWRAAAWLLEKRYPRDWGSMRTRMKLERCTCGAADYIDPRWQ